MLNKCENISAYVDGFFAFQICTVLVFRDAAHVSYFALCPLYPAFFFSKNSCVSEEDMKRKACHLLHKLS
jgi:hypothetical protein